MGRRPIPGVPQIGEFIASRLGEDDELSLNTPDLVFLANWHYGPALSQQQLIEKFLGDVRSYQAQHGKNLTTVDLSYDPASIDFVDATLGAIANYNARNPQEKIDNLIFDNAVLSNAAMQGIITQVGLGNVSTLSLNNIGLQQGDAADFFAQIIALNNPRLEFLEIYKNGLTDAAGGRIFHALLNNPFLTILSFAETENGDRSNRLGRYVEIIGDLLRSRIAYVDQPDSAPLSPHASAAVSQTNQGAIH